MATHQSTEANLNTIECKSQALVVPIAELARAFSLPGLGASSSLVPGHSVTSSKNVNSELSGLPFCPNAGWLKGVCKEHGTERWKSYPCKRRGCPVCGELRKQRIAARISFGIEKLGGSHGAGWHVLTFDCSMPKWKAVRIANQYIQKLKRFLLKKFGLVCEWAKTWERHKSGELHLNLLMSPWRYIPQSLLSQWWHKLGGGPVMWIERVGKGIGVEAAKSRYKMGLYLAKYDQMVLSGRGVSYSKGWPKLPSEAITPRRGEISWEWIGGVSQLGIEHWYETELGYWREVTLGEWASPEPERCDCFEFKASPLKRARGMREAFKRAMEIERG